MRLVDKAKRYLLESRDINAFCSQNGWVDTDSLVIELEWHDENEVLLSVRFEEIIMEGSGCVADRVERFGKLRLIIDQYGEIKRSLPV